MRQTNTEKRKGKCCVCCAMCKSRHESTNELKWYTYILVHVKPFHFFRSPCFFFFFGSYMDGFLWSTYAAALHSLYYVVEHIEPNIVVCEFLRCCCCFFWIIWARDTVYVSACLCSTFCRESWDESLVWVIVRFIFQRAWMQAKLTANNESRTITTCDLFSVNTLLCIGLGQL